MCIFNGVVTVGGQWSWVAGGSHGRVPESGLTILLLITIVIRSNPALGESALHRRIIRTTLCFAWIVRRRATPPVRSFASAAFCSSPQCCSALNWLSWRHPSGRHTRQQPPPHLDRNPARNGKGHRHRGRAGCDADGNVEVYTPGRERGGRRVCAEPLIPPGNDGRAYTERMRCARSVTDGPYPGNRAALSA